MSIEQRQHDATYDYDTPQIAALASLHERQPAPIGIGAADAYPPVSLSAADLDELEATLRRGVIIGKGSWSTLCKRAGVAIHELRRGM